jgi:Resolvase, N terminal domain
MNNEAHQKITTAHLSRMAYLYVRQSTLRQVFENTESTHRQYALRERAAALGWPLDRIVVIDSDLGQSGASAADREGFQRLVTEVSLGRAGIVLGLEVSRLARNSTDWHRLLELCALADTLILDEDGLYDPAHFNDRLLLGLNRPDTQSTSYSTSGRIKCVRSVFPFGCRSRLVFGQPVPPADIAHVLRCEASAESTAQTGTVERCGDLRIGAPRSHFVNLRNCFLRSFQRALARRRPLHDLAGYRPGPPMNLYFDLPGLALPIQLHGFDRHAQ